MTIEQAKATIQSSTLPAEIKAQALENLRLYPSGNNGLTGNPVSQAIDLFAWVLTGQGAPFWREIFNRAERGEFDPPAESVEDLDDNIIARLTRQRDTSNELLEATIAEIKRLSTQINNLIHANKSLEKRIRSLENKKP